MKRTLTLILVLTASSCGFAQEGETVAGKALFYQSAGVATTIGAFEKSPGVAIQGAPYSATINNEMIQTLPDGNRIVHTSTGTTARDSQGRLRQDAALPAIGNLSAANAPHLVFILDPVAQTSYTLDLTDKTAQKMPMSPVVTGGSDPAGGGNTFFIQMESGPAPALPLPPAPGIFLQKSLSVNEHVQESTENLGSQLMEGVLANGVRTTRIIPAGQIGNDRPISIITEVWTSPELKTIVYSKRNDPRMGEQTFRLTNIVRGEPDPSLFTVPADFKISDGPQPIIYRRNQ
jgi:hypothetical protein